MNRKILYGIICIVIIVASSVLAISYYRSSSSTSSSKTYQITDMDGRNVTIPDTVNRVIGVNWGSLRLITYLDASNLVVGVEQIETNATGKPYDMAHPEYTKLPVIGPQFGGDPELIAAQKPDVVFDTDTVVSDLNTLQSQIGAPVVGIVYGELDTPQDIQNFYTSLTLMGHIMHKDARATAVITYVSGIIQDIQNRTSNIPDPEKPSVYIGGISSHGAQGFTETSAYFSPFTITNSDNVITPAMAKKSTQPVQIDAEVLPGLNPQVIFVDLSNYGLCQQGVQNDMAVYKTIDAIKDNRTYGIMDYNWYALNFDVALTDAYYVGSVLYPNQFADVNVTQKADQIYTFLDGAPLYNQMVQLYGPFGPVNLQ